MIIKLYLFYQLHTRFTQFHMYIKIRQVTDLENQIENMESVLFDKENYKRLENKVCYYEWFYF